MLRSATDEPSCGAAFPPPTVHCHESAKPASVTAMLPCNAAEIVHGIGFYRACSSSRVVKPPLTPTVGGCRHAGPSRIGPAPARRHQSGGARADPAQERPLSPGTSRRAARAPRLSRPPRRAVGWAGPPLCRLLGVFPLTPSPPT